MSQFYRSSQISSNSAFEDRGNAGNKSQGSILESTFDFLSKNIRIFCAITRHLADIRARNMKVLEKLTDHSYRKFAFTQLATQASICLDLMRELYATVKNPNVCVILLEISSLIQKMMSILDDFFSGIAEYDKELEKEYLKEIIEYFDSIKEPQITKLSVYIDDLKIKLSSKSSSCQLKSQYERELYVKTARPLFKLKKLLFSKYIPTKNRASTQTESESKRLSGQESYHGKHLERGSSLPVDIKSEQKHEVKEEKIKIDSLKTHETDCSSTKENNNAASNSITEKERKLNGDQCLSIKKTFSRNHKPIENVVGKRTTNSADNKSSLENGSLPKNSNDSLSSFTTNKSLNDNHINVNKNESKGYQNSDARKNKLHEDDKINRTLRFAKVFCSRSIKSSSNGKNMKRFEDLIKYRMHTVLPMIKEGRISRDSLSRKRKRTIDDDVKMPSAVKHASLGIEEKRFRYDMTNVG